MSVLQTKRYFKNLFSVLDLLCRVHHVELTQKLARAIAKLAEGTHAMLTA